MAFTGSVQLLPSGNVLVGCGSQPHFSEYTETGKMLLDAVFLGKDLSCRALYTDNGWAGPTFRVLGTSEAFMVPTAGLLLVARAADRLTA